MIAHLHGKLIEKSPPQLIIELNGIGYEVDAPMSTFYQLPAVGENILIYTHFVVREDAQQLFGFFTKDERHLFRALLKVNGVGPRLALTILSSISPDEFVNTILNQDAASLVRLPGIGKKTADRLVIEMRDRLASWYQGDGNGQPLTPLKHANLGRHQILQDAISALISLGYKSPEANKTVAKVDDGKTTSEELIRLALREMM